MTVDYLSLDEHTLFERFQTLMTNSIAQLEGKPLKNGKLDYFKQEFLKQFFTHFVSIRTLAPGLKLPYKGREDEITALASVAVLTRACLENYSLFYYIYRDSNDFQEIRFRFWSWFREGLMHRQRYKTSGHAEKRDEERQEINRIFAELQGCRLYQSFNEKQKQRYQKDGKWYFCGIAALLQKAGVSQEFSDNFYNFFSSYTHPSSPGHLQTSQADYETSKALMNAMLKPLFICSALYLHNYWVLFQEILSGVNEEDRLFVTSWRDLGSRLWNEEENCT
jgi:hypothetical protein